jgi:pimeloyl-ACP methyl ester carboxylesterase
VLALCALLLGPVHDLVFAVRFALSLQKLASGKLSQQNGIRETKVRRQFEGRDHEALVYCPEKSPAKKAVVLVAGLSEQGCYHPRLMAIARLLAGEGFLVLTPDIREFRDLLITAEPVRQILFWHREVPKLEGGEKVKKTGLAGISFSGTLALMAAAEQEARDSVAFVAGIGPYSDLTRCTRDWFAADPSAVPKGYYPTRFYAKWLVMRMALGMVDSEKDRVFLHDVLTRLLLQKEIPIPDPDLTVEGARWYALAVMEENQTDAGLAAEIEQYLVSTLYAQLDPGAALTRLKCPAFFIHGAYDDLIPSRESEELHRRISHSYLLVSPFLTHTHPTDKPLSAVQKAKAALDTLVFCYHFSRAAR